MKGQGEGDEGEGNRAAGIPPRRTHSPTPNLRWPGPHRTHGHAVNTAPTRPARMPLAGV
jgi:hypothetical protein